jgi:hypothetical protein
MGTILQEFWLTGLIFMPLSNQEYSEKSTCTIQLLGKLLIRQAKNADSL